MYIIRSGAIILLIIKADYFSLFHISLAAAIHLSATTKSGFRAAALRFCAQHCKTAKRNNRVARQPQLLNLNVRHVHLRFCAISGGRKAAAARHAKRSYD